MLSILNSNLKDLRVVDFDSATQLLDIIVTGTSAAILRNSLFSGAPNLVSIRIVQSNIAKIEVNCFKGLKGLAGLYLSEGQLQQVDVGVFDDLINLEVLDLTNNSLTSLPLNIFQFNRKLKSFAAAVNQLTNVPIEIFSGKNLQSIELSFNKLSTFGNISCTALSLDNNSISTFYIPDSVIYLSIVSNNLRQFQCGSNLSVTNLLVQNNLLRNLNCIRKITNLVELDVSNNKLTRLAQSSFAQLKKLWYLKMFGMTIKNPYPRIFSGLTEVSSFSISRFGNYRNLRKFMPKLDYVEVHTAEWNCTRLTNIAKILKAQKIEFDSIDRWTVDPKSFKCRIAIQSII